MVEFILLIFFAMVIFYCGYRMTSEELADGDMSLYLMAGAVAFCVFLMIAKK